MKILDPVISIEFLIDTGSSSSLIPHKKLLPVTSTGCLMAINGTPFPTYGACEMKVSLGLNKKLNWRFTIAEVSIAVIGMDFLNFHKVWIDAGIRKLVQLPAALENLPARLGKLTC